MTGWSSADNRCETREASEPQLTRQCARSQRSCDAATAAVEKLTALADRGYYTGPEILKCEQAGINVLVPKSHTSNNLVPWARTAREKTPARGRGRKLFAKCQIRPTGWLIGAGEVMNFIAFLCGFAAAPRMTSQRCPHSPRSTRPRRVTV
jgi:hypothetical protein